MADERLHNLLATLATGLADAQRHAIADQTGLSDSAAAALIALEQFLDGCRIADIAAVLGMTHSGAVRLVRTLLDRGLAGRTLLEDGREVGVTLTPEGRELAIAGRQARAEAISSVTTGLSAQERRDIEELLARLLQALTRERLAERASGKAMPWLCRTCDLAACGRQRGQCPVAGVAATFNAP